MISEEFTVTGTPEVEVRIASGRVEIIEGDPGLVAVEVETKDPDFIVEQRGNLVFVSSDRNSGWLSRGSAFVTVRMPSGGEARVSTASARIDCEPHMGRIEVKTASGDVEVESAEIVTIKTASGDVGLGDATKAVRVATASGDIFVRGGSEGSLGCNTASGEVHIERCSGALDVNTVSGNVYVRRFTGSQANFKSMSGSIDLGIPEGTRIDLDASILSGKLRTPPTKQPSVPVERHMTVKAKLVSGDLAIDRLEA
ncbi:MAG: DUF4097 domain-containing protein [Actinobacteria bacterium]|nr:DUF4097 domain-containing protein [Actinomycetota bacterium]